MLLLLIILLTNDIWVVNKAYVANCYDEIWVYMCD